MKDWEINPDNYLKGPTGEFVLKKDGTPRKKAGRKTGTKVKNYNYTKKNQAKHAINAKIRKEKAKLKRMQAKKARVSQRLKTQERAKKALLGEADSQVFEDLPTEEAEKEILFRPHPGAQEDFLAAPEKEVLYGGAAGGGKSYVLLVDPLRYAHRSAHRALLLRRTLGELKELIDKSRELYPKAFPGAKYKESEKTWVFPSGAKLFFGYLERDADVYQYQGQAYSWIGFDEITQMPTEFFWNYLASRLRTTDPEITPYLRCTANPGGVGGHWVKKRFIDPAPVNTPFKTENGRTMRFIAAKLSDNPSLAADGEYEAMLKDLPPVLRKQLLEGDWNVNEGAAFVEFNPTVHVVTPFTIPHHWKKLKGIDWGYASESACVWGAVDPADNTLVIFRELYMKGLTGQMLADTLTQMEMEDISSTQGVLDTACWNTTPNGGPTVAKSLINTGHKVRKANKNRKAGKIQIHEYLKVPHEGRPKLQIFNTCPNLIRELQSIPLDKKDPEDVDTNAPDHAYDALRYLIMSLPSVTDYRRRFRDFHTRQTYAPSDSTFGY